MIGSQKVKYVRDLTIGYDNAQPDNKPVLPLSTSSEMITFTLENGSLCTLRASGTEPKIKYYCELKTPPGKTENDLGDVLKELEELEKAVVDTLLRPQQFGLIPRKNHLPIVVFSMNGHFSSDLGDVIKELDELEKAVVDTLLRPQQFGLIPRK
ncbi:unnamed protein product [Nippostrongylus brasiliensis]|uniref:PGM_PMM_IV domain-containing protein n=1 Tax=Nippostrongylus brasiliensis TaxID=27835 RepID=A0A0N4YTE3_NIPBR|nr:unnamed protein product [Nippostrongylus brasiliensis]